MDCQYHVFYEGRVQGVGFRWTAQRLAGDYNLSGWVKNISDGRVELVAEGERSEVEGYLAELSERMRGNIRNISSQQAPPAGLTGGFNIRY